MASVKRLSVNLPVGQTYGHLRSLRASPPFEWYQVILLGDRGTQV